MSRRDLATLTFKATALWLGAAGVVGLANAFIQAQPWQVAGGLLAIFSAALVPIVVGLFQPGSLIERWGEFVQNLR